VDGKKSLCRDSQKLTADDTDPTDLRRLKRECRCVGLRVTRIVSRSKLLQTRVAQAPSPVQNKFMSYFQKQKKTAQAGVPVPHDSVPFQQNISCHHPLDLKVKT
jgi:hypothetical protein